MKTTLEPNVAKETLRVLHAEDNDDCAVLVKRALRMAGFGRPPVRVNDGERAIGFLASATAESRPHVILLDLNMPEKNGFEVLEWVRGNPDYRATPVLMLTASQEAEEMAKAERLGATGFLAKNGTYREVVKTLEDWLGQAAAHGDGAGA